MGSCAFLKSNPFLIDTDTIFAVADVMLINAAGGIIQVQVGNFPTVSISYTIYYLYQHSII